jgi:riboflavin synthase alpha subunit
MAGIEFWYPNNPDWAEDPINWVRVGTPDINIQVTGAVTGNLLNGVINTSLTPISTSQITDFSTNVITQAKTISLDNFAVAQGNINLNGYRITNSATPSGLIDSDVATVGFVKQFAPSQEISLTGAVTGDLINGVINTSLTPISTSQITDFSTSVITQAKTISLDNFAVAQGNISLNGYRLTTSATPSGLIDSDVATVGYVKQFATVPNVSLTGAVTGQINPQGVIDTTLSAAQNLPSTFLNLVYEDTGVYGDGYFLHNFLPSNDPSPFLNLVSQAGSSSSNTLRRWDMKFKQGVGTSVTNEFELSMYHSLLPSNIVTPLKISYSIPDSRPVISLVGLLDLGNFNAYSTASPTNANHLANKGYVDYTVATYPLNLLVPTGDLDLGVYRASSSSDPVSNNHLTNKSYVDNKALNSFPVTGTIDAGANAIKSSYTPISGNDVCNKTYVDSKLNFGITKVSTPTRGTEIQLDNLKVVVKAHPSSVALYVGSVSNTLPLTITRIYNTPANVFGSQSTYFMATTTTAAPFPNDNLALDGGQYVYHLMHNTDTTGKMYRVTIHVAFITSNIIGLVLEKLI